MLTDESTVPVDGQREVRVLVASSGSLIISLDDTPVTLEAPARALPARERRMLGAGR